MDSKICMNGLCGVPCSSTERKKGWPLRSGGFASLCDKCGTAYEQLVFCDLFHSEETGWRECISCGKRLHCGCIASSSLLELLDSGGINCVSCARSCQLHPMPNHEKPKAFGTSNSNSVGETASTSLGSQINGSEPNKREGSDSVDPAALLLPHQNENTNRSVGQIKLEDAFHRTGEAGSTFSSNLCQASAESSKNVKLDSYNGYIGVKEIPGSLVQTNLSIALSAPSANTKLFPAKVDEGDLNETISSLQQESRSRNLLPKPPKSASAVGPETNAGIISQIRVARPPVEGRIKNQLLPRYWPRITDQELQQISGESNSTIIPLFEKVLSASDAGRIGRLVLPKACAEAYFPPISQPEGLPLRIQDVKGKEWVFQFRFWPNNNSRMYVLEGVTPCIQSMQLQAGDTVTFSRMDPEGKLLMGFRKAIVNSTQENRLSAIPKSVFSTEPSSFSAMPENLPLMSGYSGLLQSFKGSGESSLNLSSKHFNSGDFSWYLNEKNGGRNSDGAFSSSVPVSERKRSRNIGSKSKRLIIDSHDALELKLSWEELQDMLRPPLSTEPTTVTIEDHEFEEYEQPPVLGKKSIFTVRLSGEQEQWAQCDNCFKWRRLPADYLLPPRWTCQDNISDHNRCSCSVPDDLTPRELENLLKMDKDLKKQGSAAGQRTMQGLDSFDLDSQANGGLAGDMREAGATSVATTTKHPRHRPGCSCIVCIQPPSGKGKHNPTCTCNVCMTVKRRFKTLMMRKKKRQSEREAEIGQRNQLMWSSKEETEVDSFSRQVKPEADPSDRERSGSETLVRGHSGNQLQKLPEISKSPLDLNCHPNREDRGSSYVSMMSLLQQASLPLETYLKQNGLTSLFSEQQGSSGSQGLPHDTRETEIGVHEDQCIASTTQEQEKDVTVEKSEPDRSGKDHS